MDFKAINVTNESYEDEVLLSPVPVLVDFWAEWCGPCKMIEPIIEEIANEYDGRLKVCKANVDVTDIASKYGIRGIPTLVLFVGGESQATKVGAMSKAQLKEFIDGEL